MIDGQLFTDFGGIPAKRSFFFNNGDIVADFSRIKRCGNAGDAATDDQNLSGKVFQLVRFGELNFFNTDHAHLEVVIGQHLRMIYFKRFVALGM